MKCAPPTPEVSDPAGAADLAPLLAEAVAAGLLLRYEEAPGQVAIVMPDGATFSMAPRHVPPFLGALAHVDAVLRRLRD